jgi:hypothetical protein
LPHVSKSFKQGSNDIRQMKSPFTAIYQHNRSLLFLGLFHTQTQLEKAWIISEVFCETVRKVRQSDHFALQLDESTNIENFVELIVSLIVFVIRGRAVMKRGRAFLKNGMNNQN